MRILAASNYFPEHVGGIERVAGDLVHALRDRGHSVKWVAAEPSDCLHRGDRDDIPMPAWNVTERRLGFPYPIPDPRHRRALRRLVAASDVVHLHDCLYATNVMLFQAARSLGRPVVVTQHVAEVPYQSRALRAVQRVAYRGVAEPMLARASRVVFVSERVHGRFAEVVDERRGVVIENGVNLSAFPESRRNDRARVRAELGYKGTDPVLLFVGRFVAKKGLVHIRAAAVADPTMRWLLIGRADDEDPRAWGLANVTVRDPVPHDRIGEMYVAADLLVLPSSGEGLPVALQEALVCGTPVLTTVDTASGLADQRGVVHEWDPALGSLVSAVATALASKRAASETAPQARARWDLARVASRYEVLMQSVCAAAAIRRSTCLPSPATGRA